MLKIKNNSIEQKRYILVGPPNVGKSTFFNKITWKISPVANMERYTTTINEGNLRGTKAINIVDLPGLTTFSSTGNDEEVTIDYLLNNYYDGVINIISALSIHRDLLLTIRLAEAGILNNLVINMIDELEEEKVNIRNLEIKLKTPIAIVSAKKNQNLKTVITQLNQNKNKHVLKIKYNQKIENFLLEFQNLIPIKKFSKRFIGIEALIEQNFAINILKNENLYEEFIILKNKYKINQDDIASVNNERKKFIEEKLLYKDINYNFEAKNQYQRFKKIDNWLMKPFIAIPGFILLICLIYFLTFYQYTGGWIQDQLATNALEALQEKINNAISANGGITNTWLGGFVSDGIIGGIFTIISFVPWIIILFICINIIEQIGILSRLSIVFDHVFKKTGISGRAFVNLFVGIGCNIPGMLLSRNITNRKERVITVMCSALVSCSARVIVYGFIADAIIGNNWSWILSFVITIFSIGIALIMATFFSNTLFRNTTSLFVVQIPKWRSLDVMVIFKRVILEVYSFLKRTILIVGILNFIVWFLMSTGPNKKFILDLKNDEIINQSFLYYISLPFKYLLYPIGLGFDYRWSVSLLAAFPAKETAASTIETLFGSSEGFRDGLFNLSHNYQIAVIVSYLIMFTFYVPCLASIVVMKKEIGMKYTLISIGLIFLLSYLLSWLVFVFIASIIAIVNHERFNYIPLLMMILLIVILSFIAIINSYRINLQNKGFNEKFNLYQKFKKIYIIGFAGSAILLITATTLIMI